MTLEKYTPGPWLLCDSGGHNCFAVHADNASAIVAYTMPRFKVTKQRAEPTRPSDEDWANANLIAASPELLEALVLLHKHTAIWNNPCTGKDAEVDAVVRAAISKATIVVMGGASEKTPSGVTTRPVEDVSPAQNPASLSFDAQTASMDQHAAPADAQDGGGYDPQG